MPTASEVLEVMDRLERDPERRGEMYRGYDIFKACVADEIVGQDSVDWVAQRMQELHRDGLIAHGPVSGGVREPPVWDGQWLQSASGWRVTAPGRADAALHRRETAPTPAAHTDTSQPHDTDVFICHASEDKDTVARPLADALTAHGWSVWLDELELTVGDSLSGHIERALARSRFGVAVLSPAFFVKQWPQRELAGLAAREVDAGSKVILPVWHRIDRHYLVQRAPILADRLGALTSAGIEDVAEKISLALERAGVRAAAGEPPESVVQAVEPEDGARLTIPSTADELARLIDGRPEYWEFLLFAGLLRQGKRDLESKWDDHELRLPRGPHREFDLASAKDFMDREIGWIQKHIALDRIFSQATYEQAFGRSGEPGDAAKIEGMARRLIGMYESWLDWAAALRNTSVPSVYEEVLETTACLIDDPVVSIREFIDHAADDTARLPELAADATDDHPVTIKFTLTLEIEDEVVDRNNQAWAKLRRELN
jgi:hypothetical protein